MKMRSKSASSRLESTWPRKLQAFLRPWRKRRQLSGILVCGSYITGNPSPRSDLDVHLVLAEGTKWRERGNCIVDGLLIEYFANPPEQVREYFRSDHAAGARQAAVQFATGEIVSDRDGSIATLKREAARWLKKPLPRKAGAARELARYALWDNLDNFSDLVESASPAAAHCYHLYLRDAYLFFCAQLGYPRQGAHQIAGILSDASKRKKYLLPEFPDRIFARRLQRALSQESPKGQLKALREITSYIQAKCGGFEIDGWRLRSSVSF